MDAIDEEILWLLRENARRSFSELGRLVGLSTNAAAARVRRMEGAGIILGYTVRTGDEAPAARGALEVFIDVRLESSSDPDGFTERVAQMEQIVDAVHVTGPYDYVLRAYTPDTGTLDALLRTLKRECGVAQTQTRVALRPATAR